MSSPPPDAGPGPAPAASPGELLALLDTACDLIFSLERGGAVRYLNRAAYETLGYTAENAADLNLFRLAATPGDEKTLRRALLGLATATEAVRVEVTLRAKDGREVAVEGWLRPHSGEVVLGVFHDLTGLSSDERVNHHRNSLAEHQIIQNVAREKELTELKAHFISMISHELRTPLAALSLGVDFLAKYWPKLGAEQIDKNLKTVDATVRQLRGVLDDVLVISREADSRLRCNRVPVELAAFGRNVGDEAMVADQHRHPIVVRCSPEVGSVKVDPQLLHHVLMNLLGNACKYSSEGRLVQMEFAREGRNLVVTVEDQGIGIPAEDQARLFELFFRGSNVGSIGGTGLGLVVVRRCLEAHDGKIAFQSSPGQGTRFVATLPADAAA